MMLRVYSRASGSLLPEYRASRTKVLTLTMPFCLLFSACEGDSALFEEAAEVQALGLVSLQVVPPPNSQNTITINNAQQLQFGLVGSTETGGEIDLDVDGRRWESSNSDVVSVSDNGLITGGEDGSATVSARIGDILSNVITLTVSDSDPVSISSIEGDTDLQRCVPGEYFSFVLFEDQSIRPFDGVTYSLEQDSTATLDVSNPNIVSVNANTAGAVTLTATVDGLTQFPQQLTVLNTLQSLVISPSIALVEENDTLDFVATGTYLNGGVATTLDITDNVAWSVDEAGGGEASVERTGDNIGRLTGDDAGSVTLQALCGADVSDVGDSVVVTVAESTSVDADELVFETAGDDDELTVFVGISTALRVSLGSEFDEDDLVSNSDITFSAPDDPEGVLLDADELRNGNIVALVSGAQVRVVATIFSSGEVEANGSIIVQVLGS